MGTLFEDDEALMPVGVARALAPDASVTVPDRRPRTSRARVLPARPRRAPTGRHRRDVGGQAFAHSHSRFQFERLEFEHAFAPVRLGIHPSHQRAAPQDADLRGKIVMRLTDT